MNLISNVRNFIKDESYAVTFYDGYIHVFNYEKIIKFKSDEIIFSFINFKLYITGSNLSIKKMMNKEMLIKGNLKGLNIDDEKNNMD